MNMTLSQKQTSVVGPHLQPLPAAHSELICGGKTALHANSSSEAIGPEDWSTIYCEVETVGEVAGAEL